MEVAKIYFIAFGVLTIAGGIVGYVKAGSVASIIAGWKYTGILLLVAAFLLPQHRAIGLATAFIISLLLAAQFVPKFIRTGKVMPAGMMAIIGLVVLGAATGFAVTGGTFSGGVLGTVCRRARRLGEPACLARRRARAGARDNRERRSSRAPALSQHRACGLKRHRCVPTTQTKRIARRQRRKLPRHQRRSAALQSGPRRKRLRR